MKTILFNNFNYYPPVSSDEQFPVIAMGAMPACISGDHVIITPFDKLIDNGTTPILEAIQNCGITSFLCGSGSQPYFADSVEYFEKCLSQLTKLELKVIFQYTPTLESIDQWNTYVNVVKHYNENEKVAGWFIADEPKETDWISPLAKMRERYYKAIDPLWDKPVWFNLAVPTKITLMGDEISYPDYLTLLQFIFAPAVWCYDFYPFVIKQDLGENEWTPNDIFNGDENGMTRMDHFYNFLKIFQDLSKLTSRPFWAFCMSQGHKCYTPSGNDYKFSWYQPAPTIGMLRFEAFTALAFGAQGIIYWRFGQGIEQEIPKDNSYKLEYLKAPISRTGQLTDVYYSAQEVNQEIQRMSVCFVNTRRRGRLRST